jgi:uncharacterized protein (TIGR03083 family)
MTPEELVDALRLECAAFVDAARSDLDAAVPSCPGWDVRQLVNHLGRVQRWATAIVRDRAADPIPFPPKPPVVDLEWFEEGAAELAAALSEGEPDEHAWTFAPNARPEIRFWLRRQAVEAAVHRWDAETAVGRAPAPIETELALTGVDEALDIFLTGRQADLGGTVHLHATDSPHGEWLVRIDPEDGLAVGHGHEKGDVALRATAGDLLLWAWGRPVPDERYEVFGDETVLDRWREGLKLG